MKKNINCKSLVLALTAALTRDLVCLRKRRRDRRNAK